MSGGIRYWLAQLLEHNRLVLRFEGIGPTGRNVYTNRIGRYTITEARDA